MPRSKEALDVATTARDQLGAMLEARPLLPGTLDELGRDVLEDLADIYREIAHLKPAAARGRLLDVAAALGELQAISIRVPPDHALAGSELVQAEALEQIAGAVSAIDRGEPFAVSRAGALLEASGEEAARKGRLLLVITTRILDVGVVSDQA